MKRCFLLAFFFLVPALCLAAEDLFEIKPVADGSTPRLPSQCTE
jgi:hypothetical protein